MVSQGGPSTRAHRRMSEMTPSDMENPMITRWRANRLPSRLRRSAAHVTVSAVPMCGKACCCSAHQSTEHQECLTKVLSTKVEHTAEQISHKVFFWGWTPAF